MEWLKKPPATLRLLLEVADPWLFEEGSGEYRTCRECLETLPKDLLASPIWLIHMVGHEGDHVQVMKSESRADGVPARRLGRLVPPEWGRGS